MNSKEEFERLLQKIYPDDPKRRGIILSLAGAAWKDIGGETIDNDSMEKTVAGDLATDIRFHGPRSPYLLVQIKDTTLDTVDLSPGLYCIGSHPVNHIRLWAKDFAVSRIHCMLAVSSDNRITIYDLASTNGTFVNGEPVTDEGRELQFEGQIRVGEHYVLTLS